MNPSIDSLLFLSIYIRRIIQIIQIIAQRNIKIDSIKILENERKRERTYQNITQRFIYYYK